MKKLVLLIVLLSLAAVAMSGTVLAAVQFVEGFNTSAQVHDSAKYVSPVYTYGLKYIPTVSYNLKKVELIAGIGTGPFTVQLRPDSGGWPSSTIFLATTFTMVDTVSWQGAEFSSSYPVAAGTTYWIVFKPVAGSRASIAMGSATPITAVYDDPNNGPGWDGYVISEFSGLPLPWMAKFYKETGTVGYSATIWGFIDNEGWMDWLPITMDGVPTGYTTPHTFTGLTGTHTFTVPSIEPGLGHVFYQWSTGWTGTTLTVTSAGTYTAYYREPTAASLTVNSPNGGEKWIRGTAHTLKWSSSGSPGSYVKIELLKGGVVNKVIASSTANDGSYSWTIPSTQTLGTDYKIRITSTSKPAITDSSNSNFAIVAGTLTVTSPNGGQSWKRGTAHTITWSKSGSPGSYVKIELLKGGVVNKVITSSTANDGSYSWTIPSTQTAGTNYKIRITSTTYSSISDSSNSNFKITT